MQTQLTKNEIIFYIGIATATLITSGDLAAITFLPSMLIILWLAFRAFPIPSP